MPAIVVGASKIEIPDARLYLHMREAFIDLLTQGTAFFLDGSGEQGRFSTLVSPHTSVQFFDGERPIKRGDDFNADWARVIFEVVARTGRGSTIPAEDQVEQTLKDLAEIERG